MANKFHESIAPTLERLEQKPDDAQALRQVSSFLYQQFQVRGAVFYLDRMLVHDSSIGLKLTRAIYALGDYNKTDLTEITTALDEWQDNRILNAWIMPPLFSLAYRYGDHTDLFRKFGMGFVSKNLPIVVPARPRLRMVIIVCAQYISVFEIILEGLLTHINKDLFEIILLTTGKKTQWLEEADNLVDESFHDYENCNDAFDLIQRLQPDIIWYPELGMSDFCLRIASEKLAPLQIASWGHPITGGMPNIDLFFSGELLEPDNAENHYTETLVKLPGTGALTLTPKPITPTRFDLPRDAIRFALCQMPMKFHPDDDELYVRIAKEVGRCEFWIPTDEADLYTSFNERLINSFWDGGLDPYLYLHWFPIQDADGFAGLLDELDIYLDCPAFSGYTTALKAVRRGIPIVTLEGEFMRQRLASGLLKQIGITDTIAKNRDEYVALAVKLANEPREAQLARRNAIRQASSKADNNIAVVREFERVLIDILSKDRPNKLSEQNHGEQHISRTKGEAISLNSNLETLE